MRKESIITIKDRERDLKFRIVEMPASKLESWILRAFFALGRGSLSRGEEIFNKLAAAKGFSGLIDLLLALLSGLQYEEAKPLLDELMLCCYRIDAGVDQLCSLEMVDSFVEDVRTLFKLKREALKVNFGFFTDGGDLISLAGQAFQVSTQKVFKGIKISEVSQE